MHFNVFENFLKLIVSDSSDFLTEKIFSFMREMSEEFLQPKYYKIIFFWMKLPKIIFKHIKDHIEDNKYIQFCNDISDFVYEKFFL